MNRATHAIIMAAGQGERMRPVTETTPKPLVPVLGTRMIDTILSALHQNGIFDIYVVVGFHKEQFSSLPTEYPGVRLIENPDWSRANNISSLYYARERLGDCVILDGDQLIRDPEILRPEFQKSCYCCQWTDQPTTEWVLAVEDGLITGCSRTGGHRGWALRSVSFWSMEDGLRLRDQLEQAYTTEARHDLYWDDVALFVHPADYRLGIRPIPRDSLTEIDSYEELCQIDPGYR